MPIELTLSPEDEAFAKQVMESLYDPRVVAYLIKSSGGFLTGVINTDIDRQIATLGIDTPYKNALLKLISMSHYLTVYKAVATLDPIKNADVLVEIATSDDFLCEARLAATKRLHENQDALSKIAISRKAKSAEYAVKLINPDLQSVLLEVVLDDLSSMDTRHEAIYKLVNADGIYDDQLTSLLLRHENDPEMVDPKLSDGKFYIIESFFTLVIHKIIHQSPMLLARIAKDNIWKDIRIEAIERVPLNEETFPILIDIFNTDKWYVVCKAVADRFDSGDQNGQFHRLLFAKQYTLKGHPTGGDN